MINRDVVFLSPFHHHLVPRKLKPREKTSLTHDILVYSVRGHLKGKLMADSHFRHLATLPA